MSYSINLVFKNIEKERVLDFIKEVKVRFLDPENQHKLLKENLWYTPYMRYNYEYRDLSRSIANNINRSWIRSLFTYKFAYIDKFNCLVMISPMYSFIKDLFDSSLYAQNSCDQDYDYETWESIPSFKEISDKIRSMSKEEFKSYYNSTKPQSWSELEDEDLDETPRKYSDSNSKFDYNKKSYIYHLIYEELEPYIWGNTKDNFSISFINDYIELLDLDDLTIHLIVEYLLNEMKGNPKDYTLDYMKASYPEFIFKLLEKELDNPSDDAV